MIINTLGATGLWYTATVVNRSRRSQDAGVPKVLAPTGCKRSMSGMWRKRNNLPRFLRVCPRVSCVELGAKLNQQALRYTYYTYQSYRLTSTRPPQRQTISSF